MKRPEDAPLFLAEISVQISALDNHSDVLALGYLSEIYHVAAIYGLAELSEPIEAAFHKIYQRYRKEDPVRLHYLVSMLSQLPARYSALFLPELTEVVDRLNMPDITHMNLKVLKMNIESYKREKGA